MTQPGGTLTAADRIVATLRSARFVHVDEDELQRGIAEVLSRAEIAFEREVRLSDRDRIDFLVGGLGIEVKLAGSARSVRRQLERYAASSRVEALLLVTDRLQAAEQRRTCPVHYPGDWRRWCWPCRTREIVGRPT